MNIKKFWNENGWTIIILGVIVGIFIIWWYGGEIGVKNGENKSSPKFSSSSLIDRDNVLKSIDAIIPKFKYDPKLYRRKKNITESKGEKAMRQALLKIFHVPFTKIRPLFLRNDETGRNMEIDAYNASLKIGAEYNGKQHYTYTPGWHATYKDFAKMQERDAKKKKLCKENGITLIEIPYTVQNSEIEEYLRRELKKLGKIK
jgi:hypothetical protein